MTMPDSVSGVAGKPRDVNYDLLRVVAMCLVIGVHVINNYMPVKMTLAGSAETVRSVLFALFMVCNPLFIMVSGRFNLTFDAGRLGSTRSAGRLPGSGSDARAGGGAGQADPSSLAPYVRYYYKRFVSLIVPYLLYAGGMGFVAYLVIDHRSVGGAVSGTLFDLFSGYDDSVYWFVFMLAGFVLATPFLAAMMRAIGRSGAWLLIGLAAAVAAAEQICNLAGYPLTFLQSFPWRGLLVYYLLGFVLEYYPAVRAYTARRVCVGAVRPGLDRCHAISVRRPADAGRPHAHGLLRGGGGRGVPVLPVRRAHHVGAGAQGDYLAGGVLLHDLSGAFAAVQGADWPEDSRAYGRMVVCGYQRADVWRYVAGGAAICGDCRYRGA